MHSSVCKRQAKTVAGISHLQKAVTEPGRHACFVYMKATLQIQVHLALTREGGKNLVKLKEKQNNVTVCRVNRLWKPPKSSHSLHELKATVSQQPRCSGCWPEHFKVLDFKVTLLASHSSVGGLTTTIAKKKKNLPLFINNKNKSNNASV